MKRITDKTDLQQAFEQAINSGLKCGDGPDYDLLASPVVLGAYVVINDEYADVEYGIMNPIHCKEIKYTRESAKNIIDVFK
jgi:hypothetical protein